MKIFFFTMLGYQALITTATTELKDACEELRACLQVYYQSRGEQNEMPPMGDEKD